MTADEHEIESFLTTMRDANDLGTHYALLEGWAAEGRTELISLLAQRLLDPRAALDLEPWKVAAARFQLVQQLALTPGQAQAETAARLVVLGTELQGPAAGQGIAHAIVPLLASAQTETTLLALFERFAQEEGQGGLLLLLAQELVIRDVRLDQQPQVVRHVERMRALQHPLAALPLALVQPIEREVPGFVPVHRRNSALLCRPLRWKPARRPAGPGVRVSAQELTTPALGEQLGAAVLRWTQVSNGRVEARVFAIDRPLSLEELGVNTLRSLGLEALQGTTKAQIEVELIDSAKAFCALFVSASNGGANGSGLGGADGRLQAWRSLEACVGEHADPAAPLDFAAVARRAEACGWLLFRARGDWFHDEIADLGLLALRPGGRELAVLAATDRYNPD